LRLHSHHSPSPHPPLLNSDQISHVSSFPVHWTIGAGLPPSERGGKTYDWRAAAPTLFVFVLIATCTMACQDLAPSLATSQHPCMQPNFTPTSSPPTPLHLIAISILAIELPVRHVPLGLASVFAKVSATLHIHHTPWQRIQKSPGCNPLFPSPKSVRLWGVRRHRTG